jgi:hypothetical protein
VEPRKNLAKKRVKKKELHSQVPEVETNELQKKFQNETEMDCPKVGKSILVQKYLRNSHFQEPPISPILKPKSPILKPKSPIDKFDFSRNDEFSQLMIVNDITNEE